MIFIATLHLMVGLPGSGKTTEAIRLEKEYHALRLTPDEWHYRLFGNDFHNDDSTDGEHDRRHTIIEQIMQDTAERVLEMGGDVILDFGCWARVERDELRARAAALGADFKIHYMECSKEDLWERLQERNRLAGELPVFSVTRESLDKWYSVFQPPEKDELEP